MSFRLGLFQNRKDSACFKIEFTPGQKICELSDLQQMKVIGEGGNAKVYRAYYKENDRFYVYAIKVFSIQNALGGAKEIQNESRVLRKLCHPGIIKLHSSFRESQSQCLVLDYALHGDFSQFLRNKSIKSNETRIYYIMQIISILQYLRSHNYLHRDLKPANLLLNERFQLVLSDFGTAVQINQPAELVRKAKSWSDFNSVLCGMDTSDDLVGTQQYISPEALARSTKMTFASDLWSLGVIIWQMFSADNLTPFLGQSDEETGAKIMRGQFAMPEGEDVSGEVCDLIRRLLVLEPDQRLGAQNFSQLMAHQLFEGRRWDSLYDEEPLIPSRVRKLTKQKSIEAQCLPSTSNSQHNDSRGYDSNVSPSTAIKAYAFADIVKAQMPPEQSLLLAQTKRESVFKKQAANQDNSEESDFMSDEDSLCTSSDSDPEVEFSTVAQRSTPHRKESDGCCIQMGEKVNSTRSTCHLLGYSVIEIIKSASTCALVKKLHGTVGEPRELFLFEDGSLALVTLDGEGEVRFVSHLHRHHFKSEAAIGNQLRVRTASTEHLLFFDGHNQIKDWLSALNRSQSAFDRQSL